MKSGGTWPNLDLLLVPIDGQQEKLIRALSSCLADEAFHEVEVPRRSSLEFEALIPLKGVEIQNRNLAGDF